MFTTPILLLLLAPLPEAPLPETELSKGSRTLFPELAKLKVEKGRLVLALESTSHNISSVRQRAVSLFPGVSSVRVRSASGGSTSTSRGSGSGSVSIQFGQSGSGMTIRYEIRTANGEHVLVESSGSHGVKIEIERGKSYVRLEQTEKSCSLKLRLDGHRLSAKAATLAEIFQSNPVDAREPLFAAIEHFLGKPPFLPLTNAPPGKSFVELRDGAFIVGEIELEALELETEYGRLSIPRAELYHVFFPGARNVPGSSETSAAAGSSAGISTDGASAADSRGDASVLVVTRRFSPRGRLDLETVGLKTRYGTLELDASQILHIAFGPVKTSEAAEE